jgi:nucleoside-diphosphate-sugar epimerase
MRILVTEATSPLGRGLIHALSEVHQARALPAGFDLTDAAAVWVVCTGEPTGPLPDDAYARERAQLDAASRGVHVLFDAATQAGIRRVILCSSLELFAGYPDDVCISEHWRPDPGTDMAVLSRHLAEQVAREFARERAVSVTVLRLGRLQDEDAAAGPPDRAWLDPRDAAAAVGAALAHDRSGELNWQARFRVVHVCARAPRLRFLLDGARALGFEPRHNFEAAWSAAGAAA